MAPEQQPNQRDTFSIQRSLHELWRGLSFFFNRAPQADEIKRVQAEPSPQDRELHHKWHELIQYRQSLSTDYLGSLSIEQAKACVEQLTHKTQEYCHCIQEQQERFRTLLGRNFLGTHEWRKGFDVDVGTSPPIPEYITKELLESPCPLNPGECIKDTHLLLLMPKAVNGEPYTPLELDKLCSSRKGSGDRLIDTQFSAWKESALATRPVERIEWILIPKSGPAESLPRERQFVHKDNSGQWHVYRDFYSQDYRQARALEVMTAALLNDVVNGSPRILDEIPSKKNSAANYAACSEPSVLGYPFHVGRFTTEGLAVNSFEYLYPVLALTRKPPQEQ